ncbi:MAG: TlyA family rRNA (cytidine-2'-O)-methyltransferase [Candidatus Hydrogenedens sp.]|nr:TlyA family rRNA (cytidine-2'-O)-methyltransferase [Candidatus Hydrogenedens sp.]
MQERFGVTRSKAQGLIRTGNILDAAGEPLSKPGERLPSDVPLTLKEAMPFVSRGGEKLQAAFDAWQLDVEGAVALDAGASTGGFTDCLLQHGAQKVFAVDVGYGQLDWSLREDPRVVVMERFNVRHLLPEHVDEAPSVFTADCSFISLRTILPALAGVLAPGGWGVALIKPQFEAGRAQVGKGGVVRDEAVRQQVVDNVCEAARSLGFGEIDVIPSPLLGPAGNREYLAWLHGFTPAPSASA